MCDAAPAGLCCWVPKKKGVVGGCTMHLGGGCDHHGMVPAVLLLPPLVVTGVCSSHIAVWLVRVTWPLPVWDGWSCAAASRECVLGHYHWLPEGASSLRRYLRVCRDRQVHGDTAKTSEVNQAAIS